MKLPLGNSEGQFCFIILHQYLLNPKKQIKQKPDLFPFCSFVFDLFILRKHIQTPDFGKFCILILFVPFCSLVV